MDDKSGSPKSSKGTEGPFVAYMMIAFVSAFGCAGVAFVVFVMAISSNLTGGGFQALSTGAIWALSSTVFAPAVMGIGVSYWVHKTNSTRHTAQSSPPRESDPKIQFGIKE
jgi:hypothetical protein